MEKMTTKEEIKELTAEQKAATTEKEKARIQKRMDKLSGRIAEKEARIAELEAQLAAKDQENSGKYTEEDLNARANQLAQEHVGNLEFRRMCDVLEKEAVKINPEFTSLAMATIKEAEMPVSSALLLALEDIDNKGAVFNHIMKDVDEYERLSRLHPSKVGIAIERISQQIKPKPRTVSRVPKPNEPLNSNGTVVPQFDAYNTKDKEAWIRRRNEDIQRRGVTQGRYGR